jgi:HlyD family secretion protein
MRRKIIVSLAMAIAAVVIFPFRSSLAAGKEDPKYRTAVLTRGDITALVSTTGIVSPITLVEVGAEVSGQVVKVNADFNSPVRKGEVIAELDRAPFEDAVEQDEAGLKVAAAALDKARVDFDTAKKKYERTLDLYQKKLVSEEDKEADEEAYLEATDDVRIAEAAVKEAQAEVTSARLDLDKTQIRSPIDGVVVTRNITVGQTVTARFAAPVLFTIANDLRMMRLQCDVDEAAVGRVKEGQNVEFTVEAFPADTFTGRVIQVQDDAEVDADVVRYPVVCEVDNTQGKLRPGMTAAAAIQTGEARGVLRVPNAALQFVPPILTASMAEFVRDASKNQPEGQRPPIVWTLDKKGNLVPLVIKTGLAGSDFTEAMDGNLREGQSVVTGVESGR